MTVKEISTKHTDENGKPLFLLRDSKDYPAEDWEQILEYLKRNAKAGLLRYKIVKE